MFTVRGALQYRRNHAHELGTAPHAQAPPGMESFQPDGHHGHWNHCAVPRAVDRTSHCNGVDYLSGDGKPHVLAAIRSDTRSLAHLTTLGPMARPAAHSPRFG